MTHLSKPEIYKPLIITTVYFAFSKINLISDRISKNHSIASGLENSRHTQTHHIADIGFHSFLTILEIAQGVEQKKKRTTENEQILEFRSPF